MAEKQVLRLEWRQGDTLLAKWSAVRQGGMICLQEKGLPVLWIKGPYLEFLAAVERRFPPPRSYEGTFTITWEEEEGPCIREATMVCGGGVARWLRSEDDLPSSFNEQQTLVGWHLTRVHIDAVLGTPDGE